MSFCFWSFFVNFISFKFESGNSFAPNPLSFLLENSISLSSNLEPETWNLECGTWNAEPGTWNLIPSSCFRIGKKRIKLHVVSSLIQHRWVEIWKAFCAKMLKNWENFSSDFSQSSSNLAQNSFQISTPRYGINAKQFNSLYTFDLLYSPAPRWAFQLVVFNQFLIIEFESETRFTPSCFGIEKNQMKLLAVLSFGTGIDFNWKLNSFSFILAYVLVLGPCRYFGLRLSQFFLCKTPGEFLWGCFEKN